MLKRLDSAYVVGRKKGLWLKWKIEPLSVERGVGVRQRGAEEASLYTDYTFALCFES